MTEQKEKWMRPTETNISLTERTVKWSFGRCRGKNTTAVTEIVVLVQGVLQMLMRYFAVGDRCLVHDSFLDFCQSITRYFSQFQPPCFNCITMTCYHCYQPSLKLIAIAVSNVVQYLEANSKV